MAILDKITQIPPQAIAHFGYLIIFILSLIEAIPIIGMFIPGQIAIMLAGFFARLGILKLWQVIIIATIGAIIGDIISYYIGKKYGFRFITRFGKQKFLKKYIKKTKSLMKKHIIKTLILSRFHSFTRALAPYIAGTNKMNFSKFMALNIIGSALWAVTYSLIGYIFGESFRIAAKYVGRFLIIGIVFAIIIIYVYRWLNKKKHLFKKYHIYTLVFNITGLILFFNMLGNVLETVPETELINRLDTTISSYIPTLWNPILNKTMLVITTIGSATVLLILCLVFAILTFKKKKKYTFLMAGTILMGIILESWIKILIGRVRPVISLVHETNFSFPSGHATVSIIFFSIVIFTFKNDIKKIFYKNLFIAGNASVIILIGFSRIYLNAHWLSDVIAGFGLGLFIAALGILILKGIEGYKKTK